MDGDQWDKRLRGLELDLRILPGAKAARMLHPGHQSIDEHRHDWPWLSLHVLGAYTEEFDGGHVRFAGPSVVLHPAGGSHANRISGIGLETVSIQFDPAWLRPLGLDLVLDRTRHWTGGKVALASRALAGVWARPNASEVTLAAATAQFLSHALRCGDEARPRWLDHVSHALDDDMPAPTGDLARKLDLHPAWLARAYRRAVGEGLSETLRRKRVERAVAMLRESDCPPAQIAVAAGFCDQSHMGRGFRAVIGRTPSEVRSEGARVNALQR